MSYSSHSEFHSGPPSRMGLMASAACFGFPGAAMILAGSLVRRHRTLAAVALVLLSLLAWTAYTWIYIWLPVPWHLSMYLHAGVLLVSGSLAVWLRRLLLTSGSAKSGAGPEPGTPPTARGPMMVFWIVLTYAWALVAIMAGDFSMIPANISKTSYLLMAMGWASLSIPLGVVTGWVLGGGDGRHSLGRIGGYLCGLLWAVLAAALICTLLEFIPDYFFVLGEGFVTKFQPHDPAWFNHNQLALKLLSSGIFVGGIFLNAFYLFQVRSGWGGFIRRNFSLIILVVLLCWNVGMLRNMHLKPMYHIAEVRSVRVDPEAWRNSIKYYRAMVERYPENRFNIRLLERMESLHYDSGDREESLAILHEILQRNCDEDPDHPTCDHVRCVLASMEAAGGDAESWRPDLPGLPRIIGKESYTDADWLQILTAVRPYFAGESDILFKEKLRAVSLDRKSILLPCLQEPIAVKEAVYGLGLDLVFGAGEPADLIACLEAGLLPVILHPGRFTTVVGYNPDRQTLLVYSYPILFSEMEENYQSQYKKLSKLEIASLLYGAPSENDGSEQNQQKVKLLREESLDQLESSFLPGGVLYAVVIPRDSHGRSQTLDRLPPEIRAELQMSGDLERFYMGLNAFHTNAYETAFKAFNSAAHSPVISGYARIYAYFTRVSGLNQINNIRYSQLEWIYKNDVEDTLNNEVFRELADSGEELFDEYLDRERIPIQVFNEYLSVYGLYLTDYRIHIDRKLKFLPVVRMGEDYYRYLLSEFDYLGMQDRKMEILRKLHALLPLDTGVTLQIAEICARNGNFDEARRMIGTIPPMTRRDHRYWYVSGELAAERGDIKTAIDCFEKAAKQAVWQPHYSEKLLECDVRAGDSKGAAKTRAWLDMIDSGDTEVQP